jgi:hypothetical protein
MLSEDAQRHVRTHRLLIQPIQPQSRRGRRLLRTRPDLVDCVERMTKHSIYTIAY